MEAVLYSMVTGRGFLSKTLNAQTTKLKTDKRDHIKLKGFCTTIKATG